MCGDGVYSVLACMVLHVGHCVITTFAPRVATVSQDNGQSYLTYSSSPAMLVDKTSNLPSFVQGNSLEMV